MINESEQFNNAGSPEEVALKNILSQNILTQEIKNELNKKAEELKKLCKEMDNMPEYEESHLLHEALRTNSEQQTLVRQEITELIEKTKNEKLITQYNTLINQKARFQKYGAN